MGWIGTAGQCLYALRTFSADTDETGNIKWWGNPPASFMGETGDGAEWVIDDTAEVAIGGRRVPIVGLLGQTSYGQKVQVI